VGSIKVFISYEDGNRKLLRQTSTDKELNWFESTVGFDSQGMTYKYFIFE
jgi:hypothetical protein